MLSTGPRVAPCRLGKRGPGRRDGAANTCRELAPRSVTGAIAVDLTGRVIWPQDPDYDAARQSFNARFSRFPAAIVVCDNTDDVQNAVRWARQEGMPLRARSGGHSYEAFSVVDGGLVVDVGGLTERRRRRGARARRSSAPGFACSIATVACGSTGSPSPRGTCPGIGIAGLTLGGGIGFLSRQYGLTCDNLLAVELVDADGECCAPARASIPISSGRCAAVAAGTSGSPPPSPSACTRLARW